ncbi:fimbria/pilus periplasmic chaperone [Lysobacter sp. FW306-1B-D06B]|uniref:fimbria/pilus periplasmic chaperone n=1 Tax=Lysobacter sp. FW306-1B-D06B TaxID=3140250 RepID=UPI003140BD7B
MVIFGWSGFAGAGIVVGGTRVIYPAKEKEVTVQLVNRAGNPHLVQVWIDNGDPQVSAAETTSPFLATPPVTRVEPNKGQALRLMFTGDHQTVAQDKESVFWLNVLDVPPAPTGAAGENNLQFAVRTRIKVFYRPVGLAGDPRGAVAQLRWRLRTSGSSYVLECVNPTAYNVSFSSVGLGAEQDTRQDPMQGGGMCPAKGTESFSVSSAHSTTTDMVHYKWIDDYGAFIEGKASLSP